MTYDKDDIVSTVDGQYTYKIVGADHDEQLYDDYGDNYQGPHNLSFYESELRFATPEECKLFNTSKWIFTFGSGQLPELKTSINPMDVMLVIEAEYEREAREQVFKSFIGPYFCTSYPYEQHVAEFKEKYNMQEFSLKDLNIMRGEPDDET